MRQCPVLTYHWFRAAGERPSAAARFGISPDLFARQIRLLHDSGYRSVPLRQACRPSPRVAIVRRPIVLTFDDGTEDFFEIARPILQRHGFSAVVFVVTGLVGTDNRWDRERGEPRRKLLGWEQLRQLQREGFEIGSHTHSHRDLTTLPEHDARKEFVGSREVLRAELGEAPAHLAYPYGAHTGAHRRMAREAGYEGACACILRWRDLTRAGPFSLRRMTVKGTESMNRFRARLALAGMIPFHPEVP